MNKQALSAQREYFKMVHGVTLRLIGAFSDKDLDYRPQPGMRSVRDLILHVYGMQKTFGEGIRQGKLTAEIENKAIPETEEGKAVAASLMTVADCQKYAREAQKAGDEALAALTDDDLARPLEAPFGVFPCGNISPSLTTSTGTIAGSFTPTPVCWARNRRCFTTTKILRREGLFEFVAVQKAMAVGRAAIAFTVNANMRLIVICGLAVAAPEFSINQLSRHGSPVPRITGIPAVISEHKIIVGSDCDRRGH